MWNVPGGDIADMISRGALDRSCAEIGRDPATITRSVALPVTPDQPGDVRPAIAQATDAGFRHIILIRQAPYPDHVASWVAEEVIAPSV